MIGCLLCWLSIYALKTKFVSVVFNNPVCTSKKTQHLAVTKIDLLMLLKEISLFILIVIGNPQIQTVQLLIVKAAGT
jgi:hypothetical protein